MARLRIWLGRLAANWRRLVGNEQLVLSALAAAGLFAASLATAAPAAPPDIAFANPPRLVPADRAALEGALPRDARDAWRDGARRWGDLYVLVVEFTLRAPEGARGRRYRSVRIDARLDGPSVRAVALLPSQVEDFVEEAASATLGRALAQSAGGAVEAEPPGTRVRTLRSGLGDGARFHWAYTGGGDAPVPQGSYAVYAVLDVPRRAPRIVGEIAITCATEAETPFFFSPDRSCTAGAAAFAFDRVSEIEYGDAVGEEPGGGEAREFDDGAGALDRGARLTRIEIHSGGIIDGVRLHYRGADGGAFSSAVHGGGGGLTRTIELADDEYLTRVSGSWGTSANWGTTIAHLEFGTNRRPRAARYGARIPAKNTFEFAAPGGGEIVGFHGRAARFLNALGPVYRTSTFVPAR